MSKLADLLQKRIDPKEKGQGGVKALVERSSNLLPIFGSYKLSEEEKLQLKDLLEQFKKPQQEIEKDFEELILVTQEVKAITNQAALLHGERIQKAQKILKSYQDGAFTSWLYAAYGNRQTPYNLLQYFEFYSKVPSHLKPILDKMPRQAIYTLSSRAVSFSAKKKFVEKYQGETKEELLRQIREQFPVDSLDKRKEDLAAQFFKGVEKVHLFLKRKKVRFSKGQREQLHSLIDELKEWI